MSNVTRRALRVHSALVELRNTNGDVLDALIPFFEPILEITNGKLFDPKVFALAVRKILKWRFTADIASTFIPRLERKGYLKRKQSSYIVEYRSPDESQTDRLPIAEVLHSIIGEFGSFVGQLTGLAHYERTREQLEDVFLRFLVSLDAYDDTNILSEIQRLQISAEDQTILASLEEGGIPLGQDDRYVCARFVVELSKKRPEVVPDLARLASIGLLTEVVDDFIKPTTVATRSDLIIVVDAPLALDYLGCSGKELQEDVRAIFDSLRTIGCSFAVFPITCEEISNNLQSMLRLYPTKRHGYTHEAICRGDVMEEYVKNVAADPAAALNNAGIKLNPININGYPNLHIHFDKDKYDDFLTAVTWVKEITPREHDATCMTIVMRLRGGKNSTDIFKCRYVFVTRNSKFAYSSRSYCLESRLISAVHQGPVVNQRDLATMAWLRTGLDTGERVPRGHLFGICDRVLRPRQEVKNAITAKLKQLSPDNLEQFELMLLNTRSIQALTDLTLNSEKDADNVDPVVLLDKMRLATAADIEERYAAKLEEERNQHLKQLEERDREIARLTRERDVLATGVSLKDTL